MATNRLAIRRDTAANWTAANPTLAAGEFGLETDTGYLKNGDGATAWTSLSYASYGLNSSGNIAMPAGKGIDFSAVAGGGATSSVLDDYEEGTWTPVIRGSGTAGVYPFVVSLCTYTKIGRVVILDAIIGDISESSAGSGFLQITGLPFVKAANTSPVGSASMNPVATSAVQILGRFVSPSETAILYFAKFNAGGEVQLSDFSAFGPGTQVSMSIIYIAA